MISKKFNLNPDERRKLLRNTVFFAAPFALVFLTAIQSGASIKDAMYVLYLYG